MPSPSKPPMVTPAKTFKDVIRNFSPAWFSVNMGTGIIGALFHSYPYGGSTRIMNSFSLAFFSLNVVLFLVFLAISIARYVMFPRLIGVVLRHPVQSLYLATFPMAASTLLNVGLTTVQEYWGVGGSRLVYFLWACWWMDATVSFLCCFGLLYIMIVHHEHSMSTFTAVWLLPVITLTVASTTGQLFASALLKIHKPHALITMTVSAMMVIIGITLSFMILTLYVRRLVVEGLPQPDVMISCFLPLGPCGQAGFSLLLAGQNFKEALPQGNGSVLGDPLIGSMLNATCFSSSFLLWCMGMWWLGCALMAIVHTIVRGEKIPFSLSFWSMVFPNGVQSLLTIQLGVVMDSNFFRMLGAVYAAIILCLWCILLVPTIIQVYDRRLFTSASRQSYLPTELPPPSNLHYQSRSNTSTIEAGVFNEGKFVGFSA